MLCIICIILFLALAPIGYYFLGPIAIIIVAAGIFYFGYKKICADKCKKGGKNEI